jgi:hypothetical protein
MARLIKECEWKRDVNGFARQKVVRHVELFDKPSHGSQHVGKALLFITDLKCRGDIQHLDLKNMTQYE